MASDKRKVKFNDSFNKRNKNNNRNEYFNMEPNNKQYDIEPKNYWMESYLTLLIMFNTIIESWKGLNHLAFKTIAPSKL